MSGPYYLLELTAVILFVWVLRGLHRYRGSPTRHIPPGPKGYPIIGNLLDVPQKQEWLTYSRWADKWGRYAYVHRETCD